MDGGVVAAWVAAVVAGGAAVVSAWQARAATAQARAAQELLEVERARDAEAARQDVRLELRPYRGGMEAVVRNLGGSPAAVRAVFLARPGEVDRVDFRGLLLGLIAPADALTVDLRAADLYGALRKAGIDIDTDPAIVGAELGDGSTLVQPWPTEEG